MKHIILPDSQRLPVYLAAEEWVARHFDDGDDYFFAWQVDPTVICGRNQNVRAEIDLPYCRANGIEVCRRKSGGGAVYADRSNIMFSYITPSTQVETTFARYTGMVTGMLRGLGLDARAGGRNDIYVDGCKVSGNAFYHMAGHSIVHGTMLYDTDFTHLSHALTPSRAKLESKGVLSVESRVTVLRRHLDMSVDELRRHAERTLTDGSVEVTPAQMEEIHALAAPYFDPDWIFGRAGRRHSVRNVRIDGVGEIEVSRTGGTPGTVGHIEMTGDFFPTGDLDGLLSVVADMPADRATLLDALAGTDTSQCIRGLSTPQFVELVI